MQSVTLSSPEDREIASVNGNSQNIYGDAMWFWSDSKTFNFFPQNLKKFFPNVEFLYIYNANIATLTKTDLIPFGSQLRTFIFRSNKIEVIEDDLFDANPNLEKIMLEGNQIKFVASGAFDKLTKLTALTFISNPCLPARAENLNLIKQIESNCQDRQAYEKFKNLFTTTERVKTEQELKIEQLTAENEKLKQKLAEASLKDSLVKNMESLHAKLDMIDSKLSTTDEKFVSINATCFGLDYKLDVLKTDGWCLKPIRQP